MTENLAMWSLIVGTVLPPIVAIIMQPSWPQWARTVVAVLASLVAGFGTVWFSGQWSMDDWVTSTLIVLVTSIATYKGLWTPTGIAQKVEAATSPKPVVVPPAPEPVAVAKKPAVKKAAPAPAKKAAPKKK
jgi:hypothetical protein